MHMPIRAARAAKNRRTPQALRPGERAGHLITTPTADAMDDLGGKRHAKCLAVIYWLEGTLNGGDDGNTDRIDYGRHQRKQSD
jgi:hypothetical protein